MKTSKYVVYGIAGLAAILLALLVRGMIAGKPSTVAKASVEAPAAQPTARVLVVSHDIKAGTRLTDADLTWQDWPMASLNPAYIVDGGNPSMSASSASASGSASAAPGSESGPVAVKKNADGVVGGIAQAVSDKVAPSPARDAYVGGVARQDMFANEPVTDEKIVRADEGGFMAVMLHPGMRAMAVPVSVDNTAGGFILPGDHVDILATHQTQRASGSGTIDSVQPVLRNIRVLAIDQQVNAEKDKQSVIGATATLEVSPRDGEVLTLAKASGTLSLMLRSYADASGPSGVIDATPSGGGEQSVRVFRNGQASEVLVSR
ncbi:Flp pilus assembly protein CpaB [Asticcacaulis sp. EMRT-3]|uniref:Flp pilus assembly protein CpaB n=1 Tax=Asticcacaulis sp. EMRT-3 TaxID=3040349 RepID=UPI0024AEE71D|nr:Flp pilus assembly protein CpaB [Asticcacaulis sp. EMRT-3]MDI7776021.1 Flp pilus assembly protein CpaB [Asticcacaulis sp. EMRT-3]